MRLFSAAAVRIAPLVVHRSLAAGTAGNVRTVLPIQDGAVGAERENRPRQWRDGQVPIGPDRLPRGCGATALPRPTRLRD